MFGIFQLSRGVPVFCLMCLIFIALPHPSYSSVQPTPVADPVPVDTLQQGLLKSNRSKQARALKKAYESLKKEQFSQAIQLATKLQWDDSYSDYGYWIAAAAHRGQAQKQIEQKSFPAAIASAQKAISALLQIENINPYSPFLKSIPKEVAQAELLMADAYWGTRKWPLAQQRFERAFQRLQSQNVLILLKLDYLTHYTEMCKTNPGGLCQAWLQKLASVFIKKSEEVKVIAKHFPHILDQVKSFHPISKVTIGYKSMDLDLTAFDTAMKAYFEENFSQATRSFRQFLDDYPRSTYRFRARYWLAQSLSHEQEHEKAKKMYEDLQAESPLSYYGLLASNASGKPIEGGMAEGSPMAIETDPYLLAHETLHLKRAKNFVAEQAYDLATFELKEVKAREGLSSPFLAYLAMLNFSAKNYNTEFQVLSELIQRGYAGIFSPYGLRLIFPIDFINTIKKYSTELTLDPILVLSLIKQESAFAEDAGSPVGAMGLMQLMPATAIDTEPSVSMQGLLKAEDNIRVGSKYLRKLLTRFNGNIVLALAGYNAGPSAVDRWLKDTPPKRGMLEFIEAIPYKETREYVAAIIRNYFWYSRQITGAAQKDFNYFWNVYGPPESPAKLPSVPQPVPQAPQVKPQNGNA